MFLRLKDFHSSKKLSNLHNLRVRKMGVPRSEPLAVDQDWWWPEDSEKLSNESWDFGLCTKSENPTGPSSMILQ
jgi:hypothetical protein